MLFRPKFLAKRWVGHAHDIYFVNDEAWTKHRLRLLALSPLACGVYFFVFTTTSVLLSAMSFCRSALLSAKS